MKILIVDDNPRRHGKLLAALVPECLVREDVDIVVSANDARDALRSKQYDLMVMDILLPLRSEDDDPSERHSQELLTELMEYDELRKPHLIVGLTADRQVAERVAPLFSSRLWTVIIYEEGNESWIQQIKNCIKYIVDTARTKAVPDYGVDVAVICALADPELKAVLNLPWSWSPARPLDDLTFVYDGKFEVGGRSASVVAASCSRMGMVSAALTAARLIEITRPRLVVMTGICAGVRGKANVGDAILADPSWDWQSGKRAQRDDQSLFAIAPHQVAVDPMLRSRFEQLRTDRGLLSGIADTWHSAAPHQLKLVVGPVASSSAVLADQGFLAEIQAQHRDVCGVEMEAYGIYAAAANARAPKPRYMSIKSVCDFADHHKNDDYQSYAAFTSARVAQAFVERYLNDLR